tara:strand:+ start:2775 stop:2963 length:189 start_codon:yes stop_codon:yes gene_type:complete
MVNAVALIRDNLIRLLDQRGLILADGYDRRLEGRDVCHLRRRVTEKSGGNIATEPARGAAGA